ncbi:alanine dehydrogenase [candidate division KSB1 bacterium]|nr:MAG: alanine dehydrogenase [candidate division KSB1 bacterium]
MNIGVPKEIKNEEYRVALLPAGAEALTSNGHKVYIEKNAGMGAGYSDEDYKNSGAIILDTPEEVFKKADMILKVKEPLPQEFPYIREGLVLFTYFHFAADRNLTEFMMNSGAISIAYETVEKSDGTLPLLTPMSEVAGRMAIQVGAEFLEKMKGGRGILLGGVPGVDPANVLILGGGVVGSNAAIIAAGFGAKVTILDINVDRLRYLSEIMPRNVFTLYSDAHTIRDSLKTADLVVGGVLITGAKAPKLITREMLKLMKPGSVIVDVAVDQGGCVETTHPTTHDDPTFVVDGILHYCVANMPGAVPITSTKALNNATFPYALELANKGYEKAIKENEELKKGVNIIDKKITYKGVSDAFGLKYTPIDDII